MSSRPNPIQWTAYAYGAALPDSKRDWVANDLLGRRAAVRHLIRTQFSFLPVYVALFFAFPAGPIWVRSLTVLLAALLALIFSTSYMAQNRVRRLQKHGLGNSPLTYRQQAEAEHLKAEYDQIYAAHRAVGRAAPVADS